MHPARFGLGRKPSPRNHIGLSRRFGVFSAASALCLLGADLRADAPADADKQAPTRWVLDAPGRLGDLTPTRLGAPQPLPTPDGPGLRFDGRADGLVLPVNPLAGLNRFTIEICLKPDRDGPAEQRYFHAQDSAGHRALLELRLNPDSTWVLDTFLYSGTSRLAVIDRSKTHPAGEWHWVALVYDGRVLSGFVDGIKQGEGAVSFPPMGPGEISLGVRLNRVAWFKGALREVRIHPRALAAEELARSGR